MEHEKKVKRDRVQMVKENLTATEKERMEHLLLYADEGDAELLGLIDKAYFSGRSEAE